MKSPNLLFPQTSVAIIALAAALTGATNGRAATSLIGTTVSGSLNFPTPGTENYFDPTYSFSRSDWDNYSQGTNVVIDGNVTFGYTSYYYVYEVTFSANSFSIFGGQYNGAFPPAYFTFTDPAFASVSGIYSSFPSGATATLTGDTLSIYTPGAPYVGADYGISGDIAVVTPEPSSLSLGLAAAGSGLVALRRRNLFRA